MTRRKLSACIRPGQNRCGCRLHSGPRLTRTRTRLRTNGDGDLKTRRAERVKRSAPLFYSRRLGSCGRLHHFFIQLHYAVSPCLVLPHLGVRYHAIKLFLESSELLVQECYQFVLGVWGSHSECPSHEIELRRKCNSVAMHFHPTDALRIVFEPFRTEMGAGKTPTVF